MRYLFPGLGLLASVLIVVSAGPLAGGQVVKAPQRVLGDDTASVGLESIRAADIAADLDYFASDAMRGRDTPSPEQRVAARFIENRLRRLGFEPGNGDSFLAPYELGQRALDPTATHAEVSRAGALARLTFGVDYMHATFGESMQLDAAGPVAFGGEGTQDALSGVRADGAWLWVSGDESEWPTDDRRGMRASRYWSGRRAAAKGAGAVGLIVAPSAGYVGVPIEQLFDRVRDQRVQGQVWMPGGREPNFGADELPIVVLTTAAAQRLAGWSSVPLAEVAPGDALGFDFAEQRRTTAGDAVDAPSGRVEVENVIGLWPGSDPTLRNEVLIISAHYDHVGARGADIYNGADDNGSGSMGMLAVAGALSAHGPLSRSVALIWVSGEEKGLLGSKAWAASPTLPEGMAPVANINMDMLGRNAPEQLLYTPTPKMDEIYNGLAKLVERHAPTEGFSDLGSADEYYYRSDQVSFQKAFDIPVMFLFTDVHEDYHQPSDTPDKIDTDKIARVSRVVFRTLLDLQGPQLNL